jgi:hypothetical protein
MTAGAMLVARAGAGKGEESGAGRAGQAAVSLKACCDEPRIPQLNPKALGTCPVLPPREHARARAHRPHQLLACAPPALTPARAGR